MTRTDLRTAIAERPVVLDGGLATLLEEHGHDLSSDLWSARLLRDDPAAIEPAHREFFDGRRRGGHDIVVPGAFEGFGAEGRTATRSSACCAAASSWPPPRVTPWRPTGGWPPRSGRTARCWPTARSTAATTTSTWPGSAPSTAAARRARLDGGSTPTCWRSRPSPASPRSRPCSPSSTAAAYRRGCRCPPPTGSPGPASPSARRSRWRPTSPRSSPSASTAPRPPTPALPLPVAARGGKPAVVYPNSGQGWNAATRSWEGRSAFDPADVAAWVAAGARLVGGCCRVGTTDITALRATLARTDLTS